MGGSGGPMPRTSKYAGRGRRRDARLPAVRATEEEATLVETAAALDGLSISYVVRAGAVTEARKRLRRRGLLPLPGEAS